MSCQLSGKMLLLLFHSRPTAGNRGAAPGTTTWTNDVATSSSTSSPTHSASASSNRFSSYSMRPSVCAGENGVARMWFRGGGGATPPTFDSLADLRFSRLVTTRDQNTSLNLSRSLCGISHSKKKKKTPYFSHQTPNHKGPPGGTRGTPPYVLLATSGFRGGGGSSPWLRLWQRNCSHLTLQYHPP